MEYLFSLLVNGICLGVVYAIIAFGFVSIYRASKILNFAQGELVMIGAYVCYTFSVLFRLPFYIALPLTLCVAIVLGLVIQRWIIQPMIGQPLIAVLMMTLALLALLKGLSLTVWGADPHSLPSLFPEKPLVIGDIVIPQVYLWSFVAGLMVFGMLELFFKYARVGLAARSVCDSEQAALSVGVDVPRVYSYVWIISCVVAAVGGIFLASMLCVVPLLSDIGLLVIPVVVLGGLESIAGALIAGVIIGVTESLSGGYLETFFPAVKLVIPYVILLIVLIIKPYGLFGLKRIERV